MRRLGLFVALGLLGAGSAWADGPPPPGPNVELRPNGIEIDGRAAIPTDGLFAVGDAAPIAKSAVLDNLGRLLAKPNAPLVRIEVSTDDTAPDNDRTGAWQLDLSKRRAEAVKAYLVKHGAVASRLVAIGLGSTHPIARGTGDEARAQNRRIEFPIEIEVRAPTAADLETYTKVMKGKGPLVATIETTKGTLHCTLFSEKAPATVANFVGLATGQKPWTDAKSGQIVRGRAFYDGLTFHRVIPQFMVQGGDPSGTGAGGPGYQFADEIANDLRHEAGTLAMANAGPGTNGSQFFIDEVASPSLDGHYSVFGHCAELEVVMSIASAPRDPRDRPATPIVIKHVRIARQVVATEAPPPVPGPPGPPPPPRPR